MDDFRNRSIRVSNFRVLLRFRWLDSVEEGDFKRFDGGFQTHNLFTVDFPDVRDPGYSVSGLSREDRFRSNFGSFTVSWYCIERYQGMNSEFCRESGTGDITCSRKLRRRR